MSLVRSLMTISSHTVLSRILGYIRDVLIAQFFGANALTDALNVAIKIPSLFRRLFAEGAFNAAFVPMFAGKLATQGPQSAKLFAEHVITVLMLFLIGMTALVEIFMPTFVAMIAPGFATTPERLYHTIQFTHITFPYIIFISMAAILAGVLNSLDRFAAPASAQSIGNLCIILILYFFAHVGPNPGHAASWGVLISSLAQLLWLYFFCTRVNMSLRIRRPRLTPEMKEFFRKLFPGIVGAGVIQINLFVDIWLGSYLPEASISYINFADRINQFPLGIVGISMGVALLPLLTKQLKQGEIEEALSTQKRAVELVLLLTLPAAAGLMLCSESFVSLLYGYGKFMEAPGNVIETAYTLTAFSVGLPAYVLVKVFSSSFFARQDTLTPVIIGIISVIMNVLINLYLMRHYQHVGIAIGTAISSWINLLLLAYVLKRKDMMHWDQTTMIYILKLCVATGVMVFTLYHTQSYFIGDILKGSFFQKLGLVSILIVMGAVSFGLPACLFKCVSFRNAKEMFGTHLR